MPSRRPDRKPMTENNIPNRVRAALPRGLVDRAPSDIAAADAMMAKIRSVYALYGFEAVETPFIEYTEALGKFLPGPGPAERGHVLVQGRRRAVAFAALRPDRPPRPLRRRELRQAAEALPAASAPAGCSATRSRGQGRYDQCMQFDADTVGAGERRGRRRDLHDGRRLPRGAGARRGEYVIKVNNQKVIDGVMEAIGLGGH